MPRSGADGNRPNVLLITADQFRGDFVGAYGNPVVRTPHLDALAVQGAYFRNAFSPVPVCVPARASIMTGRVPVSLGIRNNGPTHRIPSDCVTLPRAFSAAGYRSAAIGKMHFNPWRDPHGFETFVLSEEGRQWRDPSGGDDFQAYLREVGWGGFERAHGIGNNDVRSSPSPLPLEHYHTTWCTRQTQSWLRDHVAREGQDAQPFFLWCSYIKPHSPYDPPEPYDRLYDARSFPPPIGNPSDLARLSPIYQEVRNLHLWESLSPQAVKRARALYAGNVTLLDQMLGELRETLRALNISDNTVICFTADHGDLLGDHGLFFKTSFFRGAWHVPFMLYAPGRVEQVGVTDRMVSTQDIYPTLLSVAGIETPPEAQVDGVDVSADLYDGPPVVFGSVREAPNQIHCARTSRWSYVIHPRGMYEELYDLAEDPDECINLAASESVSPEARSAMEELGTEIQAWLFDNGDFTSVNSAGQLLSDPSARGWEPKAAPRLPLSLRPY
jgi:arylsulfatase